MKLKRILKQNTVLFMVTAMLIQSIALAFFGVCEIRADQADGPDPDFHIYLAFGQSNMTGAAAIEEQDLECDDDLLMMCTYGDFQGDHEPGEREAGKWYKAVPPLADTVYAQLGVADYFARGLLEEKKKENPEAKVGIIVVAIPGTGIRAFDKDLYSSYVSSMPSEAREVYEQFYDIYGGEPYQRLVDCARLAQKDGVIKGIIMHQGEADFMVPGWDDEVEKIYKDLVSDLQLPEDTPFVAGEVRAHTHFSDMNLTVNTLSSRNENFHVVSSKQLTQKEIKDGDVHFTSEEYRVFGRRYAKKMMEAESISGGREEQNDYVVLNETEGKEYRTLSEAFEEADEDGHSELKLLKDVALIDGMIMNGKDICLDMNGHSLNLKGYNFLNYGKLSFINTGGDEEEHYFIKDFDVWEAADRLSKEQKDAAFDIDEEDSSKDVEYVRVKGSIIYNGGGFNNLGGAIINTVIDEKSGELSVDNIGFVKCIAYNGGTIVNEGGTTALCNVRAYGCRAYCGGFLYNAGGHDLSVDGGLVKYCSASDCGGAILNLGSAKVSGLEAYSCEAGKRGGAICNGTDHFAGGALGFKNSNLKNCVSTERDDLRDSICIRNSSFIMESGYVENAIRIDDSGGKYPQSSVIIHSGRFKNCEIRDEYIAKGSEVSFEGDETIVTVIQNADEPKEPDPQDPDPKEPAPGETDTKETDPDTSTDADDTHILEAETKGLIIRSNTKKEALTKPLEMKAGEIEFLSAAYNMDDDSVLGSVTWNSDNKAVTVQNGMVRAGETDKSATANIIAMAKLINPASGMVTGVISQKIEVHVAPVEVPKASHTDKSHSISLPKKLSMIMDREDAELDIEIKAKTDVDINGVRVVSVRSTNPDVVSVNRVSDFCESGKMKSAKALISPKAPGVAYIAVESTSGEGKETNVRLCRVTVSNPATDVFLKNGTLTVEDQKIINMRKGEKGTVFVSLYPENSTDMGDIKVRGSKGIVVKDGIIYAKNETKNGKSAKLTVKCGKMKRVFEVNVK